MNYCFFNLSFKLLLFFLISTSVQCPDNNTPAPNQTVPSKRLMLEHKISVESEYLEYLKILKDNFHNAKFYKLSSLIEETLLDEEYCDQVILVSKLKLELALLMNQPRRKSASINIPRLKIPPLKNVGTTPPYPGERLSRKDRNYFESLENLEILENMPFFREQ